MKPIASFLQLFRWGNVLLGCLAVVVSAYILGELDNWRVIIVATIAVASIIAASNAFNDVIDYEIDKIQRPHRPLPQHQVRIETAYYGAIALFGVGIVISTFINWQAWTIATCIATLSIVYSLYLKGTPAIGNVTIAAIIGMTFLFSGSAFGELWRLAVPAYLTFGLTTVREFVKDMADVEGDRALNVRTFPAKFGLETAERFAIVLMGTIAVGSLLPYWLTAKPAYLTLSIVGVDFPFCVPYSF